MIRSNNMNLPKSKYIKVKYYGWINISQKKNISKNNKNYSSKRT